MKLLSIIVPTYNVENYIGKCLESLIVDRDDLEVLVIIDGSKDKSCEIARSYQERFPGIFKVVEKENAHYGSCINEGLSLATGKYVKVLDADDTFSDQFASYLSMLNTTNAEAIITNYVTVDDKETIIAKREFDIEPNTTFPVEEISRKGITFLSHFVLTYRLDVLKRINYRQTEHSPYTDFEWDIKPFSSVSSFCFFSLSVYRYLMGRDGQTVNVKNRKNIMWMENRVILGLVDFYSEVKTKVSPINAKLLETFICYLVRQVYIYYLLYFPKYLRESELIEYDNTLLKKSPYFYDMVSNSKDMRKFGTFSYVRDFREKGTRKRVKYYYYDFCMAIGAITERIKKIFLKNI